MKNSKRSQVGGVQEKGYISYCLYHLACYSQPQKRERRYGGEIRDDLYGNQSINARRRSIRSALPSA